MQELDDKKAKEKTQKNGVIDILDEFDDDYDDDPWNMSDNKKKEDAKKQGKGVTDLKEDNNK